MSFVSQFLVVPLILQMVGTACVQSSPAKRIRGATIHELAPLIISLCLWACSSLLARGADKCGPGPGAAYTPALAVGATLIALIVVLAPYSRSAKIVRIADAIAISVAMASAIICLHQFGHIPKFTFNPFYCARSVSDPYRPMLTVLEFTVPMLTAWRDITAIWDVKGRLLNWYAARSRH